MIEFVAIRKHSYHHARQSIKKTTNHGLMCYKIKKSELYIVEQPVMQLKLLSFLNSINLTVLGSRLKEIKNAKKYLR